VAVASVLVASTRKDFFTYSARCTVTISVGRIVSKADLVTPPKVALIVTDFIAVTRLVEKVKLALVVPVATVMVGATLAIVASLL
jgi:hypothetical protein